MPLKYLTIYFSPLELIINKIICYCTAGCFAMGVGRIRMGSRQTHTDGSDCLLGVATRIWMDKWIAVKCNAMQREYAARIRRRQLIRQRRRYCWRARIAYERKWERCLVGAFTFCTDNSHTLAPLAFLVASVCNLENV